MNMHAGKGVIPSFGLDGSEFVSVTVERMSSVSRLEKIMIIDFKGSKAQIVRYL